MTKTTSSEQKQSREWVRTELEARGWTQKQLADVWGVSKTSVYRFIIGTESWDLAASKLCKLAAILEMNEGVLAGLLGLKEGATPAASRPYMRTRTEVPLGTISTHGDGRISRVLIHLELTPEKAGVLAASANNLLAEATRKLEAAVKKSPSVALTMNAEGP